MVSVLLTLQQAVVASLLSQLSTPVPVAPPCQALVRNLIFEVKISLGAHFTPSQDFVFLDTTQSLEKC